MGQRCSLPLKPDPLGGSSPVDDSDSSVPLRSPSSVAQATRLLYASVALGIFAGLTLDIPGADSSRGIQRVAIVIIMIPLLVLTSLVSRGRRWAAWCVIAWIAAGVPMMIPTIAALWAWYLDHHLSLVVMSAQTILQVGAVILLVRSDSREWFRARKRARAAA